MNKCRDRKLPNIVLIEKSQYRQFFEIFRKLCMYARNSLFQNSAYTGQCLVGAWLRERTDLYMNTELITNGG